MDEVGLELVFGGAVEVVFGAGVLAGGAVSGAGVAVVGGGVVEGGVVAGATVVDVAGAGAADVAGAAVVAAGVGAVVLVCLELAALRCESVFLGWEAACFACAAAFCAVVVRASVELACEAPPPQPATARAPKTAASTARLILTLLL